MPSKVSTYRLHGLPSHAPCFSYYFHRGSIRHYPMSGVSPRRNPPVSSVESTENSKVYNITRPLQRRQRPTRGTDQRLFARYLDDLRLELQNFLTTTHQSAYILGYLDAIKQTPLGMPIRLIDVVIDPRSFRHNDQIMIVKQIDLLPQNLRFAERVQERNILPSFLPALGSLPHYRKPIRPTRASLGHTSSCTNCNNNGKELVHLFSSLWTEITTRANRIQLEIVNLFNRVSKPSSDRVTRREAEEWMEKIDQLAVDALALILLSNSMRHITAHWDADKLRNNDTEKIATIYRIAQDKKTEVNLGELLGRAILAVSRHVEYARIAEYHRRLDRNG